MRVTSKELEKERGRTGGRMRESGREKERGGGRGTRRVRESGRFCAHPSHEGGNKMAGGRCGDTRRINFID